VLNSFSKTRPLGFTLIEMMIAIVILGILASIAMPSFRALMINYKIRNAAESITNGLQKARAEAVSRNTNVALTVGSDTSWQVYVVNPASAIESRSANEGSQNVTLAFKPLGSTTVTFNNFGSSLTPNPGSGVPATPFTEVDLTATGGSQSLNVTINAGGNARMCDPSLPTGSSPRAC